MSSTYNGHLVIVFAQEHYNTLNVIRSLGEGGINPVYIAVRGRARVASKSKYISECYCVETVEEGYQILISKYGDYPEEQKPIIFCSDDRTLGYLDSRYDELTGRFIFYNAGKKDGINKYMDKEEILNIAGQCGLNYAKTIVCERGEIPDGIVYPIITKSISPNVGGWKSDVFICRNEDELKEAYKHIKSPRVLLQRYVEKKNEIEYYGISVNHGEDVQFTIATEYRYLMEGYYSPYMNVIQPPFPEIHEKMKDLIRKIGFEGIFSFEFLIDEQNTLYFLEVNFRTCCWTYSSTYAGANMPCIWAKGILEHRLPEDILPEFTSFRAMVEPIDYAKRVKTGKISFGEWLADFKDAAVTYYYNKDDLAPFYFMVNNWEQLS